jgi:hypothetical protein
MYTVQPGDYLVKIARDHGIANWKTIWDHPLNAELKTKRKSPDILLAGDQVFVPVVAAKQVSLATGRQHTLKVTAPKPRLRVRVLDVNGDPVANQFCFLSVDTPLPLTTDADGRIDAPLEPDHPVEGELFFPDLKLTYHLMIGGLDPDDTPSGEKHRLNNMGYYAGVHDADQEGDADDWQLRWAQEEFDRDHGVKKPDFHKFDPEKLAKEHGS